MADRVRRSPSELPNSELVQTRINKKARDILEAQAKAEAITLASHIRRVLYRQAGLIEGES